MEYILTENWFKEKIINDNIDASLFKPAVKVCFDLQLSKLIGSHFANDLNTKFNAQTLSTDEAIVVNKIKYYMAYYVLADIVLTASYQLFNKGVQEQNGDNSQPTDKNVIYNLHNMYLSRSNGYKLDLCEFLEDNGQLFEAFISDLNKDNSCKCKCKQQPTIINNKITIF